MTAQKARQVDSSPKSNVEDLVLKRLHLLNFRCFDELDLYLDQAEAFRETSTLDGNWTCIAGINGAGKSSILQAISIALLGDLAKELGGGLLKRMRRFGMSPNERTSIEITATRNGTLVSYSVQIDNRGHLHSSLQPSVDTAIVVAYGATRNLGEETESPFKNLSPSVQSVMGLFRPLSQLASAEVLLSDRRRSPYLVKLFGDLLKQIFDESFKVEPQSDGPAIRFGVVGKDQIDASDLPDGFRSSAAWLSDLCATWINRHPENAASGDPAAIEAVVMIDEIDLPLHPAMQRELVPRLRKALPKVQWIVTTHSPLVLANFDANEIVALDRDEAGHIRRLDRQILSFTSDEIYNWLMGTRPTGAAMDRILEESSNGVAANTEVAELMRMSTTEGASSQKAQEQVAEFRQILESLKP